jgi:hypothetical protein
MLINLDSSLSLTTANWRTHMAQSRVSFVPSFVNYVMNITATKSEPKAFDTRRTGKDRVSSEVTIEAMHFDDATRSIKVFCSDGNLRECRVQRLPSLEHGRTLWKRLQEIGKEKKSISFVAAGGFSPDKWFYTVE